MSNTKLKWQWQGSSSNPVTDDLAHVSSARRQYGRVITGMLTGTRAPDQILHPTTRTTGGSGRTGG